MDSIRNHDVTILCAETGSGKSTQVPQFLFEAGFSQSDALTFSQSMIGVTQPRRVAAVSTAKRVCYEMGCGDGKRIAGRQGNMVAYQTRYETAGLGIDTHIKFMTDGILLQEIQSDLLLRKYSVIVLDEAHERNLNTDILIGLISAALPLRKKASEEKGSNLSPLKVIIMSATLRVEDFTENKNLFPTSTVHVVKVPGRTFPVTVHHSRVTELDDYEDAVFRKTCKIHRQLPQGGILVFMTGKHEIIRMVNRLRRAFTPKNERSCRNDFVVRDQSVDEDMGAIDGLRDQDDEEVDADLFRQNDADDFDDSDEDAQSSTDAHQEDDADNGIPQKAIVLPLYSLLSPEEQARVFAPVPEGHRLIVVATNIAETSISIPGLSYVVDSGRQKCRNYHAETGIASYDIMWISKAAADQRSGRAGRCGPGHSYRLYSSSLYSRYMDAFALPEVLNRPLEDVVLAMKAMKVANVSNFPFPTPPDRSQIDAALKLLANIGCVDLSGAEGGTDDGKITRLGTAISNLPLGVRYGKIMLVAAQAGVLDYAIVVVAALSESCPFVHAGQVAAMVDVENDDQDSEKSDDEIESKRIESRKWHHKGGDMLAAMLAAGAYAYAGRGAGGASEKLACNKFCQENGLHPVVMERIHKMRKHLARLSKTRLGYASGVAASTGGFISSMPPPDKVQERLLLQAIVSGFLDNVAVLAPPGSISGDYKYSLRSAYLSCSSTIKEPLFMDRNSVLFSRDTRLLPQWICYEGIVRKNLKDGKSVAIMKNISPVDPAWLGLLAKGSRLLTLEEPIESPIPYYNPEADAIMCSVRTKFGLQKWEIPPTQVIMYDALQTPEGKRNTHFMSDDSFRWFARFLFEGKVLPQLNLTDMLNDTPSIITRNTPVKKVALLVSALSGAGVDCAAALRKHWAEVSDKFLFGTMKAWIKQERVDDFKQLWISTVKENVRAWKERAN
jgi:ATP-dependent RNA helicase DHX37/DHR1